MKTLSAKDRARADATAFKTMDKKKIGIQASMDILKAMDAEKKKTNEKDDGNIVFAVLSSIWWTLMFGLSKVSHTSKKKPRSETTQAALLVVPTILLLGFFGCTEPEIYIECALAVYVAAKFLIGMCWLFTTEGAGTRYAIEIFAALTLVAVIYYAMGYFEKDNIPLF